MATSPNAGPIAANLSSSVPLQPYGGAGPVVRSFILNFTGSNAAIDVSVNSLNGMTGLINVTGVNTGTGSGYISSTTATANTDATLGPAAGPWVLVQNSTVVATYAIQTISRT